MKPVRQRHPASRARGLHPRAAAATLAAVALVATGLVAVPAGAAPAPTATGTTAATADGPAPITPKPVTPEVPVAANGTPIGAITAVEQDGNVVTLRAANGAARVTFLDDATLRVEADPSGSFTDPANTPQGDPARTSNIVVGTDEFPGTTPAVEDGDTITLATDAVTLTVDRATSRMTLTRADGSVVWEESAPITFGSNSATQHLTPSAGEQFLGGGMQNGRSIHTGATINIARSYDWDDDGYPNAVPYYMTSAGYGVLRNTFARGTYAFTQDATTTHEERRFDAYYFVGDYKESLDGYTQLTGRPHMPPVYALEYGDADCYNRSSETYKERNPNSWNVPGKLRTPDALEIARDFVEHDMPGGWMLVNDGYGCEYVELPETVAQIEAETGIKTGLWTERSLTNQAFEVGEAGIRLRKLDVAWVGSGYRMALTGCEAAHDGIEANSDARGTALMVEGWAGSQRCGMQWTGDHSGNLDAVRWQVPALLSSGNSGQAFTTGDVDGIFGGSAESYVRDLQWKAFAPALYSMSGWASVDKRPWLYGEEATEINRKYLQLRQKLMPYVYTLAAESHASGTPMMRSLALEYPDDPYAYGAEANSEFLLGEDFLVAPVSTDSDVRDGIYLPEGQWVDYWTGALYDGGRVVDGYAAPLDTLPLFVRAGAVVPQGEVARNASLVAEDSAITLDVYPQGESSFELYEDDEVTRAYADGAASRQTFSVTAPEQDAGDVVVTIGEREGDYAGKADARPYALDVHTGSAPDAVSVGGTELDEVADAAALEAAETGWFYDADAQGGVVRVKIAAVGSDATATITLTGTSAVGGEDSDAQRAHVSVAVDDQVFQGEETTARVTFHNTGTKAKDDVEIAPVVPEGWTVVSSEGTTAASVDPGGSLTATFVVSPGSGSAAGAQSVGGTATYLDAAGGERSIMGTNQIDVAYGSLAAAFNHVSITSVATKGAGNFDGGGASFSEDALAAAGATWGQPLAVQRGEDTIEFQWPDSDPGVPNSMALNGQTVALSGKGTHLAFLGSSATGAGVTPEVTVTYADGTTSTQTFYFPNWLIQASGPLKDSVVAVASKGRNNANNPDGYEYPTYTYQVYANVAPLNPTKELRSVTFPTGTTAKLFDVRPVTLGLPDAPAGDAWVSDLEWTSATNGYGVIGIDVANKDSASSPDLPLVINTTPELKKTYEKGLGVHAASKVTYYLGGQCTRFTADTGLEDGFNGSVIFKVNLDDVNRYQGSTFQAGFPTETVDLDLTGAHYIDLIVDAPGSINGAHGVWGDARFECGGDEPQVAFSVEAQPRTMAGKIYLAVRVVNDEDVPVDVTVSTPYGEKTFADVAPGTNAYQSFATRRSAIEAGEVTVEATKSVDGEDVTSAQTVGYDAAG
ncbi:NPCBM/NEW2 domain-containing protein [Cellulosimicrobium cellulans]|uniref:NPCBM/NEW2 domain-containing protein n=1 Tax=Cellulosimicrobium cellulans TaxID=1710 RepID=UPI0024071AA1|nr:NPCBM/NEW2 domain-containing protein [Cellulosimicrobium cellulans]MDF9875433.1 alpha-glucosidase [Cellulosimicrobium cellulans]